MLYASDNSSDWGNMVNFYLIDTANSLELPGLRFRELRRYAKYSLEWLNAALCIVGQGNANTKKILKPGDYDRLLFDTLSLVEEPKGNTWDWGRQLIDEKRLFKWLEKHGLPVSHMGCAPAIDAEDSTIPSTAVFSYYPLQDFANHVGGLYLMYMLFEAITDEDEVKIPRYIRFLTSHPLIRFAPDGPREKKLESYEAQIIGLPLNEKIRAGHQSIGSRLNVELNSMKLGYEPSQQAFYIEAFSLFDLCYYRFAVLIAQAKSSRVGHRSHVKRCDNCQKVFWGHGNRRYCSFCDRRTIWSQRNKQKKGVNHERTRSQER